MKLSEKIEGYDSMSAEEKLKALEALEVEDNSSDLQKLKEAFNKTSSEVADYKKKLKAKEEELNSKLSEDERKEKERKEAEAEKDALLQSLLKDKSIAEHKANFLKVGYDEEMATASASALTDGDFKTVFDNLGKFISDRDKKAQVKALDSTPRPQAGSVTEVTQEQFNKMSIAERTKLYETNKELYDSLSKGE